MTISKEKFFFVNFDDSTLHKNSLETILIIEDEDHLRGLLQAIIEEEGYKVIATTDGLEAVEIFRNHHDTISLVITDMGLPKMGGWEAFQEMKKIDPNVRTIMASGFLAVSLRNEMLKAGAKDFIQKPYAPEIILEKIRDVLDLP